MCLPITIRQTVKGIARNSPTTPHSQVQKVAATSKASGETPVRFPYNHGSSNMLLINSSMMKSPMASNGRVQPSKTANDNAIGIAAATHGPTYGMKRNTTVSAPQSTALGTSRNHNPAATQQPCQVLMSVC